MSNKKKNVALKACRIVALVAVGASLALNLVCGHWCLAAVDAAVLAAVI